MLFRCTLSARRLPLTSSALGEFCELQSQFMFAKELNVHVRVNTDTAIAGTFGSKNHVEYSVLGNSGKLLVDPAQLLLMHVSVSEHGIWSNGMSSAHRCCC